ncbi:MAG: nitroreductase [Caulobacteraceae bacterium]
MSSAAFPAPPQFADPLPPWASPEVVRFLARRRSTSAMTLVAPGPDEAETNGLLRLAARAPDHGKLAPWRFIVLRDRAKAVFVERLAVIAASRPDGVKLTAKLAKLRAPPLTVAVISRHTPGEIPEWEQRLSVGAVCTLLILAAAARGWGANWITDWYAYDAEATALLPLASGEKVAGFIHLGTPAEPPLERPRPDVEPLVALWRG